MTAKSGNNTVITITTTSLVGYKIYEKGNTLSVLMGQPNKIFKNVLVLDAGHGGHDPGAQNNGTNEKDLTHKIIYTLMKDKFAGNAPDTKCTGPEQMTVMLPLPIGQLLQNLFVRMRLSVCI